MTLKKITVITIRNIYNRKILSPKKAKKIAEILGYSPEQFVALAIQDSLDRDHIHMLVEIKVA